MQSISVSRTRSIQYQARKFEITLDVPESWSIKEVTNVATALANTAVGYQYKHPSQERKMVRLVNRYFGTSINYLNEFFDPHNTV